MYNWLMHIVFLGSKKRRKGVAKTSHRRIVCRRTVPSPNWHRRNILSPKNPSPKRPSRRKVRRRNVLSPNSPIAELAIAKTSCRRNGVAESASPKRRRRTVLDRFIVCNFNRESPFTLFYPGLKSLNQLST